jgi:hypothetical protein
VPEEAVGLVLREDVDAANARVDAVREREIYDPVLPTEVHGRLGSAVRQMGEAGTPTTRQDECDRFASESTRGCFERHCTDRVNHAIGRPRYAIAESVVDEAL